MIDRIFSQVQVEDASNHLGSEWEDVQDAPPIVLWLPKRGEFVFGQSVTRVQGPHNSIATCRLTVTVRLWTAWPAATPLPSGYSQSQADLQVLWELIRKFLVTLRTEAPGTYELGELRFLGEEGDALVELGKAAEVDVQFLLPVLRDALETVTVTDPAKLIQEGTADLEPDEVGIPAP